MGRVFVCPAQALPYKKRSFYYRCGKAKQNNNRLLLSCDLCKDDVKLNRKMEVQPQDAFLPKPQVKATFCLKSETYSLEAKKGTLSEQLVYVKEESMGILKDFITRHNALNDVPDEPIESSSEEDDEILEKPQVKSKKTKRT